ncbi:MAG: hypothetical protein KA118_04645 [Verrucomicrobia bacterium]|nr:hypothetical protein [Verrucomicrobiota bacterium]
MNAIRALPSTPRAPRRASRILLLTLVWLTPAVSALAQPRIITQPRTVAVQYGQEAHFLVVAAGSAPLAYQWSLNGWPLEGETTDRLSRADVDDSKLGYYEVTVSNGDGQVTSAPAWLLLANRWTELVFVGASDGQQMCAAGPPWIQQLANRLGIPLRNYSVAGAEDSAVRAQISAYLNSHTPTTNILFSLWVGGSEDAATGDVERAASNRLDHVRALAAAGARSFLIPRIPPLAFAPKFHANYPNFRNEMATTYDALLDASLDPLQAEYGLTVFRPDLFAWTTAVWDNPKDYGFPDPPANKFYCDGFHMTFAAHQLVMEECHRCMTPPIRIISRILQESSPAPSGNIVELGLQAGGPPFPPFLYQHCEDLNRGSWQGFVSYWTNCHWVTSREREFFRVISVGQ